MGKRRKRRNKTGGSDASSSGNSYNQKWVKASGPTAENLDYFLDAARLDPADDPTLQPYVDEIQREALESYDRSTYQLHDQLAKSKLLGSSFYQGALVGAQEEFDEAQATNLANIYVGARSEALKNKLEALGLLSSREVADANIRGGVAQARISAAPAHAAVALDRAKWKANQPWTDIGNAISVMQGIGGLSGFNESPNFIPQPAPYYGPSPAASAIMGGISGAANAYGMGWFGGGSATPSAAQNAANMQYSIPPLQYGAQYYNSGRF